MKFFVLLTNRTRFSLESKLRSYIGQTRSVVLEATLSKVLSVPKRNNFYSLKRWMLVLKSGLSITEATKGA